MPRVFRQQYTRPIPPDAQHVTLRTKKGDTVAAVRFRGSDGKIRFFRIDRHCKRMHDGADRLCIPPIDKDLMREAILALVRADADWVPSSPGTSLYIRPTIIATEPFLGVRPAKRFTFFVIASPVGAYGGGAAFTPARILVEDNYVRAAVGGLGGVKAGANYIASLRAAEDAKARGYAQVLWTDAAEHTSPPCRHWPTTR